MRSFLSIASSSGDLMPKVSSTLGAHPSRWVGDAQSAPARLLVRCYCLLAPSFVHWGWKAMIDRDRSAPPPHSIRGRLTRRLHAWQPSMSSFRGFAPSRFSGRLLHSTTRRPKLCRSCGSWTVIAPNAGACCDSRTGHGCVVGRVIDCRPSLGRLTLIGTSARRAPIWGAALSG